MRWRLTEPSEVASGAALASKCDVGVFKGGIGSRTQRLAPAAWAAGAHVCLQVGEGSGSNRMSGMHAEQEC